MSDGLLFHSKLGGCAMSTIILLVFLVAVCIWDIKTFEIPSPFIIIGVLLGLGTNFYTDGLNGTLTSFISLFIVLLLTFSIWAIGESFFGSSIIGAGDMKLLMVISSFLGVHATIIVFYWSILLAGFLFIFMISPKEIIGLFKNIFHFFMYAIPKSDVVTKKLAFSVPITLATCYVIFF